MTDMIQSVVQSVQIRPDQPVVRVMGNSAGPRGPKGDQGLQGPQGDPAPNPSYTYVINTLAAGAAATIAAAGVYPDIQLTFGIPKGDKGDQGIQGIQGPQGDPAPNPNYTYAINTLAAGSTATLDASGVYPDVTLTFGIPQGEQGPPGQDGQGLTDGDKGDVVVANAGTGSESWTVQTINGQTPITTADKGVANGVCPLDATSKIAAVYLPAYVDDVLEYANLAAFPGTGSSGLIYVAQDTNKTYRWSGSAYVEISASPGTTDSLTEGVANLYFTQARVLATPATGLADTAGTPAAGDALLTVLGKIKKALFTDLPATIRGTALTGFAVAGANAAIVATDSILTAFGKIQKQINDLQAASGGFTDVALSADFSTTNTATTDCGLNIPAATFAANSKYEIEFYATVRTDGGRINADFVMPTGCTTANGFVRGLAGVSQTVAQTGSGTANVTNINAGTGVDASFEGKAQVVTGGSAATAAMQLKFGQSSAGTLTVKKGSFIKYRKIG